MEEMSAAAMVEAAHQEQEREEEEKEEKAAEVYGGVWGVRNQVDVVTVWDLQASPNQKSVQAATPRGEPRSAGRPQIFEEASHVPPMTRTKSPFSALIHQQPRHHARSLPLSPSPAVDSAAADHAQRRFSSARH